MDGCAGDDWFARAEIVGRDAATRSIEAANHLDANISYKPVRA
jgi:hypothetical protein